MDHVVHGVQEMRGHIARMLPNYIVQILVYDVRFVNIVLHTNGVNVLHNGGGGHVAQQHGTQLFQDVGTHNIAIPGLNMKTLVQLQKVYHAANVGLVHGLDGIDGGVGNLNTLLASNIANKMVNVLGRQLVVSNTDEFVLQILVDFTDVVANEAKPDMGRRGLQQVF